MKNKKKIIILREINLFIFEIVSRMDAIIGRKRATKTVADDNKILFSLLFFNLH